MFTPFRFQTYPRNVTKYTRNNFSVANTIHVWRCFQINHQDLVDIRAWPGYNFILCGWPPASSSNNEFDVTNEYTGKTIWVCGDFPFPIYIKKGSCPLSVPSHAPNSYLAASSGLMHGRHMFNYNMLIFIICLQIRSQAFCNIKAPALLHEAPALQPCPHLCLCHGPIR